MVSEGCPEGQADHHWHRAAEEVDREIDQAGVKDRHLGTERRDESKDPETKRALENLDNPLPRA